MGYQPGSVVGDSTVLESQCCSDWPGFWAKKIPSPKLYQQAQRL